MRAGWHSYRYECRVLLFHALDPIVAIPRARLDGEHGQLLHRGLCRIVHTRPVLDTRTRRWSGHGKNVFVGEAAHMGVPELATAVKDVEREWCRLTTHPLRKSALRHSALQAFSEGPAKTQVSVWCGPR